MFWIFLGLTAAFVCILNSQFFLTSPKVNCFAFVRNSDIRSQPFFEFSLLPKFSYCIPVLSFPVCFFLHPKLIQKNRCPKNCWHRESDFRTHKFYTFSIPFYTFKRSNSPVLCTQIPRLGKGPCGDARPTWPHWSVRLSEELGTTTVPYFFRGKETIGPLVVTPTWRRCLGVSKSAAWASEGSELKICRTLLLVFSCLIHHDQSQVSRNWLSRTSMRTTRQPWRNALSWIRTALPEATFPWRAFPGARGKVWLT